MTLGFLAGLYWSAFREAIERTFDADPWMSVILAPCLFVAPFYALKVTFGSESPRPSDDTEIALGALRDAGFDGPQRMYYFAGFLGLSLLNMFLLWRAITGK